MADRLEQKLPLVYYIKHRASIVHNPTKIVKSLPPTKPNDQNKKCRPMPKPSPKNDEKLSRLERDNPEPVRKSLPFLALARLHPGTYDRGSK